MTETPPPPSETPDHSSAEPATPEKKDRRTTGQKWRRRTIVVLATLLLIGVIVRAAVPLLLPPVLQGVASAYGFDATYDDLDFYILGGDVGLWNLRITPKGGSEPVLQTQYCRAAISTMGLLRGRLHVRRAEADAAVVTIERAPDGSIPLLQQFSAGGPRPASRPAGDRTISLEPPLRIDILRLQNAEAHLRDKSVSPVVDVTMSLSMLVSNVGVPDAKTSFSMQLNSAAGTPQLLGALLVDGTGYSTPDRASAEFSVRMIDLNLRPAEAYLSAFGITPQARHISFVGQGTLEAQNNNVSAEKTPVRGLSTTAAATSPAATRLATAPATIPASVLPATTQPGTLSARLEFKGLSLTADSQSAASIDRVAVTASSIGGSDLRLAADVSGVRVAAQRRADGRPQFAGIAFGGTPQAGAPTPAAPSTRPATQAVQAAPTTLPAITLEALRVSDVAFTFADHAVAQARPLTLAIDRLTVRDFDTRTGKPAVIEVRGSAPGLAAAFSADGTAELVGPRQSFEMAVRATGITPTALDPYLKPFGLRREMRDAEFTGKIGATLAQNPDGSLNAGLTLADLLLQQGGAELVNMQTVQVDDLYVGPAMSNVRLGKTRVWGPSLSIQRHENGTVAAIGYVFDPAALPSGPAAPSPANGPAAPSPAVASATVPAQVALPAIEISDFEWGNVALRYADAASTPPVAFALRDVRAQIRDLRLDPSAPPGKPGTFNLLVSSPGNFDQFSVNGSVTPAFRAPGDVPTPRPHNSNNRLLQFDVNGSATGMHFAELRPVLESFGLQPVMKAGALSFQISGGVDESVTGPADAPVRSVEMGIKLGDVRLTDGDTNWFTLRELTLDKAKYDGTINIAGFTISDSLLKVHRDAQGRLQAAGFKLVPPKRKKTTTTRPAVPAVTPATPAGEAAADATPATQPAEPALPDTRFRLESPIAATLTKFNVVNSQVDWTDDAVEPVVKLRPRLDLTLDNITVGKDVGPGEIDLTLNLPEVVDRLNVRGRFKAAPDEVMANLFVKAENISGPGLAPYLPTSRLDAAQGTLQAKAFVSAGPHPDGGTAARLAVFDVAVQDGRRPDPGLAMKRLALTLNRFDLPGRVVAFDEFTVEGLTIDAVQDGDLIRVGGLALGGQAPPAKPKPPAAEGEDEVFDFSQTQELTIEQLLAKTENNAPLVSLGKLSIGIDRLSFSGPDFTEPVALTDIKIETPEQALAPNGARPAIELLGPQPQRLPPFWITTTAKVSKLVDSINVRKRFAPFAAQPSIAAFVDVTGIHGDQLATIAPKLGNYIAGSELTDGSFGMRFESDFSFTRRGPIGIDLTRDITANFALTDVALKQAGNDKPLLGLSALRGERIRYSNVSKSLTAQLVTIETPIAQIIREKDGLHAAGFIFKLPEPAPAAGTTQTTGPDGSLPPEQPPEANPPTADGITEANPIQIDGARIETLVLSGIDLYLADRANEPASILPITDLDAEVRGLSTRLLQTRDAKVSFSGLVGAGGVELPKRPAVGGIIGVFGDAASLLGGQKVDEKPEFENRPVFAQAQANGNFSIVDETQAAAPGERTPPIRPSGYLKFGLSGFELTSVRGLAAEQGINIQGGTFDVRGEVLMQGTRDLNAQIYPTFNDLSVSEPANGPIVRFLQLPFNLDAVLFALEDSSKRISLPVNVPIDAGELKKDKIVGSVIGSISRQIIAAVGAAPAKALTIGTNIIGFNLGGKDKSLEPVTLTYAPGESQLTADQLKQVNQLINRLRGDAELQVRIVHELGSDDHALLEQRANPSPQEAGQLGYQLRQRKLELQTRRLELASQLRVALASQDTKLAADTQSALRSVSQQIAATERAMDQALDMLRPNADRQANRRTRQSSADLGNLRLDIVRETLLDSGVADIAGRVERVPARPDPVEGQAEGRIGIIVTRQAKK